MYYRHGAPVDIDRLLIVTFTNAAAAEMRSRLSVRLRQILAADPGNANAKRQLSLLSGADICTIDAFCLKLVRENFFSESGGGLPPAGRERK